LAHPGREAEKLADQDFRISALILVLMMAKKLKNPFAAFKYMGGDLVYRPTAFGEDEFNRVTLHSTISFLLEVDAQKLKMSEEDFQKKVEESDDSIFETRA